MSRRRRGNVSSELSIGGVQVPTALAACPRTSGDVECPPQLSCVLSSCSGRDVQGQFSAGVVQEGVQGPVQLPR